MLGYGADTLGALQTHVAVVAQALERCGKGSSGETLRASATAVSVPGLHPKPLGSKVLKYGVYMASIVGIVVVVWGIYTVFGYLDP